MSANQRELNCFLFYSPINRGLCLVMSSVIVLSSVIISYGNPRGGFPGFRNEKTKQIKNIKILDSFFSI